MQIQKTNNVNFNADFKVTPTLKNLYNTAEPKTKEEFLKVLNAVKKRNDSLTYSFAYSQAKRNNKDYLHIAMLEEYRNADYITVRQVVELPEYYTDSKEACENNKNLLEKFMKHFKKKYVEEMKDDSISYELLNKFFNN